VSDSSRTEKEKILKIMRFLQLPVSQLALALILSFAVLAIFTVMDLSIDPQFSSILTRIVGALLAAGVILLLGRALQGKALDKIGISPRGALSQIMQGCINRRAHDGIGHWADGADGLVQSCGCQFRYVCALAHSDPVSFCRAL
jgi:hypothetical protein